MTDINPLSFLATISATYFAMLVYQRAVYTRKSKQNTMAILVLSSLGWWCLCDVFFYVAPTVEVAWFWHRLGAPGWCGFIVLTSYYFIVMTGADKRFSRPFEAAYWVIPLVLTVRFMVATPTGLADNLVQSGSGLGWMFVLNFNTVWPYALLAYLVVYLGGALVHLYRWQKGVTNLCTRNLAKGYVWLDCIAVTVGFVSLIVVPQVSSYLPLIGFLCTMIFGLWYWIHLRDYDFAFVELALNPSYVYESCIDGLVVTDEDHLVLYANGEAQRILSDAEPEGKPFASYVAPEYRGIRTLFSRAECGAPSRFNFVAKTGAPVMCSVSCTKVRGSRMDVYVVHLSDVTQMQQARENLEHLAYHDAMTHLHNRRYLNDVLPQWAHEADAGERFALLFIDVTGFKHVNDTYGHAIGDDALVAVGNALEQVVGANGEVVRYAGDEFVVLTHAKDPEALSARLQSAVRAIDGSAIAPGLSLSVDIGGCRYSEVGNVDELLRKADQRMYEKKNSR